MAKVKQTVTTTRTKTRKRKIGKGMKKCPRCGGDGVVRKK